MADLLLPGRRGVQPPAGVGVDWNNPLTKDLGGLFDTRAGVELVYNNRASNYTTLLKAARAGVAADFSGTANQQYAHCPGYATTGAMTIFALMEVDALTNYSAVIAKQQTTTVNVPFEFRLGSAATGSDFNFVRASASSGANSKQTTGSRLSAAPGVPRAIAITVADGLLGTIPIAYVDKVKTSFNANSTAGSCTDSAQPVWIGRRYDGATQLDGPMYFVALWNRELSENEVGSLTDNPWQLFRPAQRRIWVPVAGGGNNQTIAFTLDDVTAAFSQALSHDQSLSGTLDGVTVSISQTAQHDQALSATLDDVTVAISQTLGNATNQTLAIVLDDVTAAVSQTLSHSQALAATLDGVTVAVSQALSHDQTLAITLDDVVVSIAQQGALPAVGGMGFTLVDMPSTMWWKRKPKAITEEVAKKKIKRVVRAIEQAAQVAQPIAQQREVYQAIAPLLADMPGFDWKQVFRLIVAQDTARRQMETTIARAKFIEQDEEEVLMLLLSH